MIQKHCEILKKIGFQPKTILEIGSRDANDANYYKEQFNVDSSNVYIVEPNPSQFKIISENYPDFVKFQYAIDLVDGTKEFNQVMEGGQDPIGVSSLLNRSDNFYERFKTEKIVVDTMTGAKLLETINEPIDICKIDVEGYSYEVLVSMGDSIKNIRSLHIEAEMTEFWKDQKLYTEVFDYLRSKGFKMVWYEPTGGNAQIDSVWVSDYIYDVMLKEIFDDIEIHMLICKRDMLLAINNFKSLLKYEEFQKMPIYLHDDGSLDDVDIETLEFEVENAIVIKRADADRDIVQYISEYPNCVRYRVVKNDINLWHKIKLFDYYYFSKSKKIFGLDTDLLFMRKPENIIKCIIEGNPFYFPDIQSAYCFNEPKEEVAVLERVNTGVIYIPSPDYYHISDIENALKNLVGKGVNYFPSWIEQSAFAHMFYCDGRYEMLNDDKYTIPYFKVVDIKQIECLHFVSYPAVRETYQIYTDYLEFKDGDLIYDEKFIVEYKDQNIPLGIKIFKYNNMFNFTYYWGLEETTQHQLDHIFRIITDETTHEFKCQSNNNGFFIVNTKGSFQIEHTYDWYGEMNWKILNNINND